MSDSQPLRIAIAAEGPTDAIVLRAILDAVLPGMEFEVQTLQPEMSAAFSTTGQGWVGVNRWCRQASAEGSGAVSGSSVLKFHDVVVVQVDADVAGMEYSSGSITNPPANDLPCEKPCPPPGDTTDSLRNVILTWLGESTQPPQLVLCTPSKSIETWVLAALCPKNSLVKRSDWECRKNPEGQFATLPKSEKFAKRPADYEERRDGIVTGWPVVSSRLSEASRFEADVVSAVSSKRPADE